MDVIIDEMKSTVRAMDSEALLHPHVLEQIIRKVMAAIKEHHSHEDAVKEERKMRPSMTSREISFWE
jgi:hypothetical protein